MERSSVKSSSVVSCGYDKESKTLEVEYNGGTVYRFADVPPDVYDSLMATESVGKFLRTLPKGVRVKQE